MKILKKIGEKLDKLKQRFARIKLTRIEKITARKAAERAADIIEEKIANRLAKKFNWDEKKVKDFKKGYKSAKKSHIGIFTLYMEAVFKTEKLKAAFVNVDSDKYVDEMVNLTLDDLNEKGVFNSKNEDELNNKLSEIRKEQEKELKKFVKVHKDELGDPKW